MALSQVTSMCYAWFPFSLGNRILILPFLVVSPNVMGLNITLSCSRCWIVLAIVIVYILIYLSVMHINIFLYPKYTLIDCFSS